MNSKFVKYLEEGRPRLSDEEVERRAQEKADKPKGKRGRPKKEDDENDDSGKGGVRDVTLVATIKIDGDKQTKEKKLKGVDVSKIDDEISKWEKALNKEFDYEGEINIKKKVGDYEDKDSAEDFMTNDDGGDDEDEFSLGRKDR